MTQLHGLFSLRTSKDLLTKLESDFNRFKNAEATSIEAQYAAFDFFVTAEHLADWMSNCTGDSLSSYRAYPDGSLVSHVANGAKHFRVTHMNHKTVSDTHSAGAFQANAFQENAFDVARLVIDLEDGSTENALDVALRVVNHWRKIVSSS